MVVTSLFGEKDIERLEAKREAVEDSKSGKTQVVVSLTSRFVGVLALSGREWPFV